MAALVVTLTAITVPSVWVLTHNEVTVKPVAAAQPAAAEKVAQEEPPRETSLWSEENAVDAVTHSDRAPVELGTRFTAAQSGWATGVRFYKARGEKGEHTGSVWDSSGRRLAQVTFAGESSSGWQEARFASPVRLEAKQIYTVSYHSKNGTYVGTQGSAPARSGPLVTTSRDAGVFGYGGSAFPKRSNPKGYNYWVDVVFRWRHRHPRPTAWPSPTSSTTTGPTWSPRPTWTRPVPTWTSTPGPTWTRPVPTLTSTPGPTWTRPVPTWTSTPEPTWTSSPEPTWTVKPPRPTPTWTHSPRPTSTWTRTPRPTPTWTRTPRPTPTWTHSPRPTSTWTRTPLPTPTSGPSGTPTPSPTRTTPRPTLTPDPTSSPQPGGGGCAYPTPACAGVPAGTKLSERSLNEDNAAYRVTTPGAVIDGVHIAGDLLIHADGVTVKNSQIDGTVLNANGPKTFRFTIVDSTVGPAKGCESLPAIGQDKYTALRVLVRNHGDGFRAAGDDITIRDSYVKLCSNPGDHSDGIQTYNTGKNLVFDHNTVDQRGVKDYTAPIFLTDPQIVNVTLTNNLIMGGTYSIQLRNGRGTLIVRGNRLVDKSWDYAAVESDCSKIDWADNSLVTIDSNYRITSIVGPLPCAPK
ncbi:DUF4082 domain-containing protein [Streptosporangium sp. NPDC051022]|uniref:DUF4082 domain-containing protein n=1 Tax=Streptosporangium sp. NPDC051022 TaxID=3155752 RepID=UPI00341F3D09